MNKISKREDYISWDEYFMGIALLSAKRSKDPSTPVGACIVSKENRILSMGYNGTPNNMSDDDFNWSREGKLLDTKYLYVVHAEANAIMNYKGGSLEGAKIYTTLASCNNCALLIAQAGIKEVIYMSDKYADVDSFIAGKKIFKDCGIINRLYEPTNKKINLDL